MQIELTEQNAEFAVAIKKRANMENLQSLISEGYGMIYSYLTELGKQPSGAPYVVYYGIGDEFDIEMGFPVAEELPGKDELYLGKTYEGRIVTGTHKGSYDGLDKAYGEIFKYMEDNKLELVGIYYDYYLNDPSITPESELLTKIVIPIK